MSHCLKNHTDTILSLVLTQEQFERFKQTKGHALLLGVDSFLIALTTHKTKHQTCIITLLIPIGIN